MPPYVHNLVLWFCCQLTSLPTLATLFSCLTYQMSQRNMIFDCGFTWSSINQCLVRLYLSAQVYGAYIYGTIEVICVIVHLCSTAHAQRAKQTRDASVRTYITKWLEGRCQRYWRGVRTVIHQYRTGSNTLNSSRFQSHLIFFFTRCYGQVKRRSGSVLGLV